METALNDVDVTDCLPNFPPTTEISFVYEETAFFADSLS